MPEQETLERAREDALEGRSPPTQAGEFVREEMHYIREGKHGAASTKQAIAIGLSKARRAGVKLQAKGSAATRKKAALLVVFLLWLRGQRLLDRFARQHLVTHGCVVDEAGNDDSDLL